MRNIEWNTVRAKVRDAVLTLPYFFKNPVHGMTNVPDWGWIETLILQGIFAAGCGILRDLLSRDFLGVVLSVVLGPLANYFVIGIVTGIFYYIFMFFFNREVPFRRLYLHVLFASIPGMIVSILANMIPPIMLIGALAGAMLLYVGLVAEFQADRKKLRTLLIGLMIVYSLSWMVQLINTSSHQKKLRLRATPESLDILQKELGH